VEYFVNENEIQNLVKRNYRELQELITVGQEFYDAQVLLQTHSHISSSYQM